MTTFINLTNADVTIGDATIGAMGWQAIQHAPKAGTVHIVDIFQALTTYGRDDLAVVSELLATGKDRTAVALAHAGYTVTRDGMHAVSSSGADRIRLLDKLTVTQLRHLQDDEPSSY